MSDWYVLDVNPEPWTAPSGSIARSKTGKPYVQMHKDGQLTAYQEAIREALVASYSPSPVDYDVALTFFVWRNLGRYSTDKRRTTKHVIDMTNAQKATEDALQGLLFKNDRQVKSIHTYEMAEQSPDIEGGLVIMIDKFVRPTFKMVHEIRAKHLEWQRGQREAAREQEQTRDVKDVF